MIVVSVELWSAKTGEKTLLGRMIVANKGGTTTRGDYDVRVGRKGRLTPPQVWNEPLRTGEVLSYPRLSYNVWRLVLRALRSAFPEEKGA